MNLPTSLPIRMGTKARNPILLIYSTLGHVLYSVIETTQSKVAWRKVVIPFKPHKPSQSIEPSVLVVFTHLCINSPARHLLTLLCPSVLVRHCTLTYVLESCMMSGTAYVTSILGRPPPTVDSTPTAAIRFIRVLYQF